MNKKIPLSVVISIVMAALAAAGYTVVNDLPAPAPVVQNAPIAEVIPTTPLSDALAVHVGPDELYPSVQLTPGKADTLDVADLTRYYTDHCPSGKTSCTYSQDHRNVPGAEHTQVYDEYNVPAAERNIQNGEVDHFYPLCAGGSNDISNLWYEKIDLEWNGQNFGFKTKDKLESWICVEIKAGRLDPQEAFIELTKDWVAYYLKNEAAINGTSAKNGSVNTLTGSIK